MQPQVCEPLHARVVYHTRWERRRRQLPWFNPVSLRLASISLGLTENGMPQQGGSPRCFISAPHGLAVARRPLALQTSDTYIVQRVTVHNHIATCCRIDVCEKYLDK